MIRLSLCQICIFFFFTQNAFSEFYFELVWFLWFFFSFCLQDIDNDETDEDGDEEEDDDDEDDEYDGKEKGFIGQCMVFFNKYIFLKL